jgi:hypothetical protein
MCQRPVNVLDSLKLTVLVGKKGKKFSKMPVGQVVRRKILYSEKPARNLEVIEEAEDL